MYKKDLTLSNLQELICHKTQPKQQREPRQPIVSVQQLIKIQKVKEQWTQDTSESIMIKRKKRQNIPKLQMSFQRREKQIDSKEI